MLTSASSVHRYVLGSMFYFKKKALFLLIPKSKKYKMGFLYVFLTSIILSLTAQSDIPYTTIEKAFVSNDASHIVALGKDKMLINILGKEGAYSQSQANLVLKDFFTKKPGTTFKFIFKGKETADGSFAIGTYESKGESYRVTLHFKKIGSDFKIESLNIEKA
ncbi:MAG: hypothetical protein RI883_662 [Bacteroidota bacterium]|jgi:hypothetical protein